MPHRTDATPRAGEGDRDDLRLITHDGLGSLGRWALTPVIAPEEERLTTWMSVDPSPVVDVEEHR